VREYIYLNICNNHYFQQVTPSQATIHQAKSKRDTEAVSLMARRLVQNVCTNFPGLLDNRKTNHNRHTGLIQLFIHGIDKCEVEVCDVLVDRHAFQEFQRFSRFVLSHSRNVKSGVIPRNWLVVNVHAYSLLAQAVPRKNFVQIGTYFVQPSE
jgi:hypothetical protein